MKNGQKRNTGEKWKKDKTGRTRQLGKWDKTRERESIGRNRKIWGENGKSGENRKQRGQIGKQAIWKKQENVTN